MNGQLTSHVHPAAVRPYMRRAASGGKRASPQRIPPLVWMARELVVVGRK
jgi:hypothetical protein